jgi:hypothetical protein
MDARVLIVWFAERTWAQRFEVPGWLLKLRPQAVQWVPLMRIIPP